MNKRLLESYQVNKRLIERNKKKIEEERCKDIPEVMGKVTGSAHDFPYIRQRFTVRMDEPVEAAKSSNRIEKWQQEIDRAGKEMEKVERFIAGIEDAQSREIFTYRYIDGMKAVEVARKVGYTHGRVSQIISKYLKD